VIIAAALSFACILCWATGFVPEIVAALGFFAIATLTGVAQPAMVFSGFASSAFWLVLSGMIVGTAVVRTGLGARLARQIARVCSDSYTHLVAAMVALAFCLAFVMPSNMGRVALLVPMVLALADELGLEPGRLGRIGLVLAVGFGTFPLSSAILPANVPNMVMAGSAETLYGVRIGYLPYLLLHAPVLGLAKGVLLVVLIVRLFPDRLSAASMPAGVRAPWSGEERRLSAILIGTLLLWGTDSLHHVSPAWIGLGAALLCMAPRVGVLPPEAFNAVNFRTVFYIAALLGLVAVITSTGLGAAIGQGLIAVAPFSPEAPGRDFGLLVGLSTILSLLTTANGAPALYTALADDLARQTGLTLDTVLMAQVLGYSTVLLPYQAAPVVVACELGQVPLKYATRLSLASGVLSLLLLGPADYVWWRCLGAIA
jgi:di/tricarboxylate transporter